MFRVKNLVYSVPICANVATARTVKQTAMTQMMVIMTYLTVVIDQVIVNKKAISKKHQ